MPLKASTISDLIDLLWKLDDAQKQGLITNPQSDNLEAAVKAAIDEAIAD